MRSDTHSSLSLWGILLASAFCYSLGPVWYMDFIKGGLQAEVTVAYFLCVGGSCMLLMWLWRPGAARVSEQVRQVQLKHVPLMVIESSTMPLYFLLFIYAMQAGTITETSLLSRLGPILAVALSVRFLGERILSWRGLLFAIALCLSGVLLLNGNAIVEFHLEAAVLLGLLVAVTEAVRKVLISKVQRLSAVTESGLVSFSMIIGGFGLLVILSAIDGITRYPTTYEYLGIFGLGFVTVAVPKLLSMMAYTRSDRQSLVSTSTYFIPIFTGVLAYLWHGERIDLGPFAAAFVLILAGLMLFARAVAPPQRTAVEA